jgi:hypothetical protein
MLLLTHITQNTEAVKTALLKKNFKEIESNIKTLKQLIERIINEIGNFARKNELEILKKQVKMFEPLEFARMDDVRKIVNEEIKKLK